MKTVPGKSVDGTGHFSVAFLRCRAQRRIALEFSGDGLLCPLRDCRIRIEGVDGILEGEQSVVVGQGRASCRQGRVYWGADT